VRSRLTLVLLAMVLVTGCAGLSLPKAVSLPNVGLGCVRTAPTPLHGAGSKLVDASGSEVRLTGVNWSGMETSTFAPHGLWARKLDDMLGQIASSGFNAIRLPFTNQLFDPGSVPNGIDLYQNADLKGLNGLALMDRVVERARCYGLRIILDRHRPSVGGAPPPLWYTAQVPDERWIADWVSHPLTVRSLQEHHRG
jgi:endoglucanase